MFEGSGSGVGGVTTRVPDPLTTADLTAFTARLRALPAAVTEGENVDRLRLLEDLKAVCGAVQARETVAFHDSRRDAEAARGIPADKRARGVAAEVALARRDSPARGSRHLGLARALVREMPNTMAALEAGGISEWRATLVAKETGWLPVEGRRHVDEELASQLTQLGDRAVAARARALAQAWDPAEAVRHLRHAETERSVTIRPAPDTMVYLTALLPMARGIAAWASLDRDAKTLIGTGQAGDRSRGQVMADIFVERLTGQETAAAVPVEVHLVMSDTALFGAMTAATVAADGVADGADNTDGAAAPDPTETPAWIVGHGPIPAAVARDLLDPAHDGPSGNPRVWIRRLYTHPDTGHLVAMESTRRRFDGLLRRMIILRDDTCRTPWCDAPIRHTDHATRHAYGGGTTYVNGSGLCERCNLGKEQEKWKHEATPEALQVTTPTGHTYLAETPPLLRGHPGPTRGQPEHSTLEDHFALTIGIHYPRAS